MFDCDSKSLLLTANETRELSRELMTSIETWIQNVFPSLFLSSFLSLFFQPLFVGSSRELAETDSRCVSLHYVPKLIHHSGNTPA